MDICCSVEFVFGPGRSFTQNAETAAEGEWGRVNDREDLSSSHGLMIQAAWYAGTFLQAAVVEELEPCSVHGSCSTEAEVE